MKIDTTFANEIRKQANGDGSREHRIAFKFGIAKVAKDLEKSRYEFDKHIQKHGRVKVGLCVAATIMKQAYRCESPQIDWAQRVLAEWTNKTPDAISSAVVNMHPAILTDISGSLRRLTITVN
jgi:hypothetical protein